MKHLYSSISLIILSFVLSSSFAQLNYTFTSAGATGEYGPTQTEVNSEYLNTSLQAAVTSNNGIQEWTVPSGGVYSIDAYGAQGGGSNGGKGAHIYSEFTFTAGDVLYIIVGQQGTENDNGTGGGGGSYVVLNNNALVIAGGGGGNNGTANAACDGQAGTDGEDGMGQTAGLGGSGGNSGQSTNRGQGGAGWLQDGPVLTQSTTDTPAKKFDNGGDGGFHNSSPGGYGGFGGAGGSWNTGFRGSGGGGGYSGGGAGYYAGNTTAHYGGGAGSYNTGANPVELSGVQSGDGMVVITVLTSPVPNEAGVTSINPSAGSCAGTYPLDISVSNFGINQINNVTVNWTVNGGALNTQTYNGLIDTIGGNGNSTVDINVGNVTISGNTEIVAWTTNPNNQPDTVNTNDTASVSYYASDPQLDLEDIALCDGSFEILSAGLEWESYLWNTNATSHQIVITTPGTYTVTVLDTFDCPAVDSVEVENGVTPVVNMGGTIEACDFATLNSGTANGTYLWSDSSTTQTITVDESGQYLVTVTSAQGCVGSGGVDVTIHDSPEINLGPDATICVDLQESHILSVGNGYSVYQWNTGQNSSSITINASQGWPMGWNDFNLTVTDANGCSATDSTRVRLQNCIPQGITSASDESFQLFPNPADNVVILNFTNSSDSKTISIYDLTGRLIQKHADVSGTQTTLDVDGIDSGTYQVVVESEGHSDFKTLVIK